MGHPVDRVLRLAAVDTQLLRYFQLYLIDQEGRCV